MKKIFFSILIAANFFIIASPVFAFTEVDCKARGGSCKADSCAGSGDTIGTCFGEGIGNKINCCGNASQAQKTGNSVSGGAQNVTNPLAVNSFSDLFTKMMSYFKSIAATLAVIFIVLGGVMYMISAGNKEMMEKAKKTLIFAMVGLAIVIAAPLFLEDILLILKGGGSGGSSKLLIVVLNVLRLLLSIVGALGILGLLNSAVIMLVSTGDDKTLGAAKKSFAHACIGIALAAGALVLIKAMKDMILGPPPATVVTMLPVDQFSAIIKELKIP